MTPYYETESGQIYHGDVLKILYNLPDESVHCCVTSPPYWGLRDYGIDGQLGLEKTPEEYVSKMVEIFSEVKRVLRGDGTLWLNLGDSYFGSLKGSGGTGEMSKKQNSNTGANFKVGGERVVWREHSTLKPKDLIGIPWRVAFALQEDWYLRSDIIWHKPNPMPESVTDRPTKAHEYMFLLSKSAKYYYDADAIREPHTYPTKNKMAVYAEDYRNKVNGKYKDSTMGGGGTGFKGHSGSFKADGTPLNHPNGRNKRTVWTIPTQPMPEAHFATFPEKLIKPCILAGSPKGGTVLDPFFGSGTTGIVAYKHDRKFIGIDLSETYLDKIAIPRINKERKQRKLF